MFLLNFRLILPFLPRTTLLIYITVTEISPFKFILYKHTPMQHLQIYVSLLDFKFIIHIISMYNDFIICFLTVILPIITCFNSAYVQ